MKRERMPEEQLAAARVPREAWPYEVPEGWTWVRLGTVTCNHGQKKPEQEFTYIDIGSIDNAHQRLGSLDNRMMPQDAPSRARKIVRQGDILYSTVRPYLHNMCMVTKKIEPEPIASTGFSVLSPMEKMDGTFLFHYLKTRTFDDYANDPLNSRGINYPAIQEKVLLQAPVPLPPLAEQKKIVARLEKYFAKLDAAEKKIDAADELFSVQKNALLHAAFSGKLSGEWRINKGVLFNGKYQRKELREVCKSIYDGDHMPPPKSAEGIPFLVISNVNKGHLDFRDTRFVLQTYYDGLSDTRKPQKGDVLYTLVGSYGIPVLVDREQPFCFQRHMGLLKPDKMQIDSKYLWYALQTREMYQQATTIAKGTAQLTVPIKGLRLLTIPLPSLDEQREIVRRLDGLLAHVERARGAVDAARARVRDLRAALLARAFRGEL